MGLAGGLNLYAYAPNPLSWIDPLGLTRTCSLTKSKHALQRHREGRPVGPAINDLQNARPSDILIQTKDNRWVILGPKERVHIIEGNGSEIITTMNNPRRNTNSRLNDGRWRRMTLEEEEKFKEIFSDYVRF
ncbi:hypothetical protein ACE6X6_004164 [Salmonella enterica subsp. enterica]